ncbi:MAG TPA: LD-carboxypeptidase [Longimicrobiales bacterium]|nr:LD-carboxypeptidase [Longimicrobiales bacterium]
MKPGGAAPRPRALRAGARVALVAPAGPVDTERIERAAARCRALGLEPVVMPCAAARERYMAGTDAQRLADLQAAFDDPSVGCVWALRGGYGTLRIVEALSLERQRREPVPFIGFSDNTSLHVRHAELGVVSFHGPHAPDDGLPEAAEAWLHRVLFEPVPAGRLPVAAGGPEPLPLRPGRAEGPLVGGNLAILAALCGTRHAPRTAGCIVFLEDVGEAAYRVDRMLVQLERSGALRGAVGLAFGRFTAPADDPFPVVDVLAELAERLSLPAVANLPFGHVRANFVIPVGARARLDAGATTLEILEPAVAPA